jgi:hypothetical protein
MLGAVKRPVKIAVSIAGGTLAILLLLGALLAGRIHAVAQATVEESSTNTLGLTTTTRRASLNLFAGTLAIHQMQVANVEGYTAEHLMTTDRIRLSVLYSTLLSDPLRVPGVEISDLTLHIERRGLASNISQMLQNMRQRSSEAPATPGRTLVIDEVAVRNVTAEIALGVAGRDRPVKIRIPELVLRDVTPQTLGAATSEEVLRRIVPAILAAVLEEGGDLIPADFLNALGADLSRTLATLGEESQRLVQQAAGELANELLKDVSQFDKPLQDAGQRLRGILDRAKPPE